MRRSASRRRCRPVDSARTPARGRARRGRGSRRPRGRARSRRRAGPRGSARCRPQPSPRRARWARRRPSTSTRPLSRASEAAEHVDEVRPARCLRRRRRRRSRPRGRRASRRSRVARPSRRGTTASRMRSFGGSAVVGAAGSADASSPALGADGASASVISPSAIASARSETGRPTIAWASVRASARSMSLIESTTRPRRRIVTTSVAWRISSSLWLTSATALPSSSHRYVRSTSNSCSDSWGVSTDVGSSKMTMLGIAPEALDDLDPLAQSGREIADDARRDRGRGRSDRRSRRRVAGRTAVEAGRVRRARRSPTRAARRRG